MKKMGKGLPENKKKNNLKQLQHIFGNMNIMLLSVTEFDLDGKVHIALKLFT
jgi:hypothetical protein